ncbi:MAG: hypothetical protein ACRC2T_11045 [Thermoguttaceae bacterium]
MSDFPIVSPNMFEALDLSDEQQEELAGIKKEMDAEFEKHLDKLADIENKCDEMVASVSKEKTKEVKSIDERTKIINGISKEFSQSNPEYKKLINERNESNELFAHKLKFKMFDVLTDEQLERMSELINNPPDKYKSAIATIRERFRAEAESQTGEWRPGINSWKPGDGIPEEYLQHRKERTQRFPKKT